VGLLAEATYESGRRQLKPGDRLVIVTDGVSEALKKIRGAAAGQRITNNARDRFWIKWIGLGRAWNGKQYRKSDD